MTMICPKCGGKAERECMCGGWFKHICEVCGYRDDMEKFIKEEEKKC